MTYLSFTIYILKSWLRKESLSNKWYWKKLESQVQKNKTRLLSAFHWRCYCSVAPITSQIREGNGMAPSRNHILMSNTNQKWGF